MKRYSMSLTSFWRTHIWVLPVLAALLFHGAALFGSFVYDDVHLIVRHPQLASEGFMREIWTRDYGLEFAGETRGSYRPLFMSTVIALYRIAGPNPFTFRLFSLLCFCAATVLVTVAALRASGGSRNIAIVTGLLYAVHPTRVETVSLFMSLPDLLVEMYALGIFLLLLRHLSNPGLSGRWIPAACFVLSAAASVTKSSSFFLLPALAVTAGIYAYVHRKKLSLRPTISAVAVFIGLTPGLILRQLAGIHSPISFTHAISRMLNEQAISSLKALAFGVRDIIVPGPTVFWNLFHAKDSNAAVAVAVILCAGIIGLLWVLSLRHSVPAIPLLAAWLVASVVNLVLLTTSGYPYSQRYLAVAPALILLCLGVCYVFQTTARWRKSSLAPLLVATYLAAHGAYTLAGTFTCWSSVSFFTAMHEAKPHEVDPLVFLAERLNGENAPAAEVENRVRQATSLDRTNRKVSGLHNMMVIRHIDDRNLINALRFVDWSLSVFPADTEKMALRASVLASLGSMEKSLAAIDAAISTCPDRDEYHTLRKRIVETMNRSSAR